MLIYFDGAIRPKNPGGTAAYGWIIKTTSGITLQSGHENIGSDEGMTNNIAEYTGLLKALQWLMTSGFFDGNEKIHIRGDSALVCNMVSKKWGWEKTKEGVRTGRWTPHEKFPRLKKLLLEIIDLLQTNYIDYVVEWVPREQNTEADELSGLSYK